MMTYLLINSIFFIVILMVLRIRLRRPSRATTITFIILILLTAVFDSIIVGFGIVGYNPEKILGVYIGKAPIEDFFYAVLACLVVPRIWKLKGKKHVRNN